MFSYPIAISISPNSDKSDFLLALKLVLNPISWLRGKDVKKVESWFLKYLHAKVAVSYNSGRSALYSLLKAYGIGLGDEVIVQAYTCVAVPNSVLWTGAKVIYADIDDSLNIDVRLLEKYISRNTKALIVQHTFGTPANLNLIKKITHKRNIILIEDCSHSLGAKYFGKKIGSIGDASVFSFGRDKVLSSVFGGMAVINKGPIKLIKELRFLQNKCNDVTYFWVFQQLLHPIIFYFVLPIYKYKIGKIVIYILQKLNLLSKPIYSEEYNSNRPKIFPSKMPNVLALLLLNQIKKLNKYNSIRKSNALLYNSLLKNSKYIKIPKFDSNSIYLRYNILVNKSKQLLIKAKKINIILGNWYKHVIDPEKVNYNKIGYSLGSCQKAEEISELSVNLPTYPRLKRQDIKLVVDFLNKYANQ